MSQINTAETQSPQTTPPRHGHVSSPSTAAYPSSKRGPQEHIPPKDSSHRRSSSRKNVQEYTPPSDSSLHPSSSRSPQEYTPPSDEPRRPSAFSQVHAHGDRGRLERDREREKEKERRKYSDSDEQEPEAFSGKKELHPTFSPAIVRTPVYYSKRTSTPNATLTKASSIRHASDDPGVPPRETSPYRLPPSPPLPSPSKDKHSHSHSQNHSRSNSLSEVDDKPRRAPQRSDTFTSRTVPPIPYDERLQPPVYYSSSSSSSVRRPSWSMARSQVYPSLDPVSENPYLSTRLDSSDGRESRNPPTSNRQQNRPLLKRHSEEL